MSFYSIPDDPRHEFYSGAIETGAAIEDKYIVSQQAYKDDLPFASIADCSDPTRSAKNPNSSWYVGEI
jgi:hypothetical protein